MLTSTKTLTRIAQYDVLVIGSGIAGICAALAAGEAGSRVCLACKGPLFSGSSFYPGTWGLGLIGPEDPADREDLIRTIEAVGCGMADHGLVRTFVDGITPAVEKMETLGVRLRKAQAGSGQREYIPCFDHKHRAWNGIEFDSARPVLSGRLKDLGVCIRQGWEALTLVREEGRVCGAVFCDGTDLHYLGCRSLVLATGGYGSLFRHHLCTGDVEGVGQALALNAGCRLVNLEFMQIMPGYLSPAYGTIFNEKVFRYSILESQGKPLLKKDDEKELLEIRSGHGPFTSRLPSRAVDLAMAEAPVTVRYRKALTEDPPEFVRTYFDWLRSAKGLTPEDSIEIGLFSHAANGGIYIDSQGFTGIPGLYAAGEVTGGMHGADRIGGLSTANGLVFGGRAGTAAARNVGLASPDSCPFSMVAARNVRETFRALQEIMTANALVSRTEAGLLEAISRIRDLTRGLITAPSDNIPQIAGTCRLNLQLQTALSILSAQLLRRESRGSHYRSDYPEQSSRMDRRILIRQEDEGPRAFWEN